MRTRRFAILFTVLIALMVGAVAVMPMAAAQSDGEETVVFVTNTPQVADVIEVVATVEPAPAADSSPADEVAAEVVRQSQTFMWITLGLIVVFALGVFAIVFPLLAKMVPPEYVPALRQIEIGAIDTGRKVVGGLREQAKLTESDFDDDLLAMLADRLEKQRAKVAGVVTEPPGMSAAPL